MKHLTASIVAVATLAAAVTTVAGALQAGQISVISPPNIVTPQPIVPPAIVAPVSPAIVAPVSPVVGAGPTPGFSGAAQSNPRVGATGRVPPAIQSFPVASMSPPQMRQAIAAIERLDAAGKLPPRQARILRQQAAAMRQALSQR